MSAPIDDRAAMEAALEEARRAAERGEVPVGAVVVHEGQIIATAGNSREGDQDPFGHAELSAMRAAAAHLRSWRLTGCTLFVTLEPCTMCAGAIVLSRIDRVVFGATDPKAGAAGSLYDIPADERLNHRPPVEGGLLAEDSTALLQAFFRARRKGKVATEAGEGSSSD